MARNSKTKKNARYRKKQKRNRLDMRSGGRVSLQYGGDPAQDYEDRRSRGYGFEDRDRNGGTPPPPGLGAGEQPPKNGNTPPPVPPPPPPPPPGDTPPPPPPGDTPPPPVDETPPPVDETPPPPPPPPPVDETPPPPTEETPPPTDEETPPPIVAPPTVEDDILPDEPVVAPETEIDVKPPTAPDAPIEYGDQTDDSETSLKLNEDGTPQLDDKGNPIGGFIDADGNIQASYYLDTVSNTYQPTKELLEDSAKRGFVWDVENQKFVDPDVGYSQYLTDEQELERQKRYEKSAKDLEAAKRGELDIPQITKPEMIQYGPDSKVSQMVYNTKVDDQQIYQEGETVPTEAVVTGTTATSAVPNAVTASTYTAAQITTGETDYAALVTAATEGKAYAGGEGPSYNPETGMVEQGGISTPFKSWTPEQFAKDQGLDIQNYKVPLVDAQTGSVSPLAIAGMQSQALTKAAVGVTIDDETASKALADRVVGVLSDDALANEQAVKGLNLPKVLRAKKQLRNAGLTEDQIDAIGNDPEDLEARLMEFTEQERGMIEGLPEEALVSNQMNTLLQGLDNGEVPTWARPAVSAVNQMLAQRGLDVSTVGRDALFNAIIQTSMPLAQANAQAIQQAVSQQKGIEAQAEIQNAQMRQQTALTNAGNVFNMNMAQFSADQQTELSNSKFLQTVGLTNASNEQQAVIQEAASLAQLDLATLDSKTKLSAQNAQSFLAMDMTNLSNRQQSEVLGAQLNQQRLLSNQAATNAASQFNSTSENQTNQFMENLAQQTRTFNTTQKNAMEQFNKQQTNAAEARRVQNQVEVDKADALMKIQIDQFNSQQDFARNQWNTQNAQAVQQADMKWRRQVNTANTAATNAVNQQNAMNAFGLSSQAQAFMWQELRDQADYAFRSADNYEQRKSAMYIAMLGNESGNYEGGNWKDYMNGAKSLLDGFLG